MTRYRRAIVLAHRGQAWTLLQNASRQLCNTVNSLHQACSSENNSPLLAALYGLSCKPLYFAAVGLTDLLTQSEMGLSNEMVPQALPLRFTGGMDDCNMVGVMFIKQAVFLAVHVLYVHEHWEEMIGVAVQFDDATK